MCDAKRYKRLMRQKVQQQHATMSLARREARNIRFGMKFKTGNALDNFNRERRTSDKAI
jgi:hypothetical protein